MFAWLRPLKFPLARTTFPITARAARGLRLLGSLRHAGHSVWYPITVGLVVHVVVSALPMLADEGSREFREHLQSWKSINLALLAALAVWIIELYGKFGGDFETLQRFRTIVAGFQAPTTQYGLRRLTDHIRQVSLEIEQLRTSGLGQRTLKDKIEIIEAILADVGPAVSKYWATTLDRPSSLWPLNRFWKLQEDLLKHTPSKRRMVILDRTVLREEIHDHHDVLKEFVTWHIKEGFELLFLIDEGDTYLTEADQFLDKLSAQQVVTDFAVVNDKYVYGEVAQRTTSGPNTEDRVRQLLLYGPDQLGHRIVMDYVQFYNELWQKWRGYKWRVMSSSQVLSECSRQKSKQELLPQTTPYYGALGVGAGSTCYDGVRQRIASAQERVLAVDIAPLKSNLLDWTMKPDYAQWQQATCDAARKAKASRIYVLNERMETRADREVTLGKILRPQASAGVQVWLAGAEALRQKGVPVHDFILVDNVLCLSLGWDEAFDANTVSVAKNMEHQTAFSWYERVFENIVSSGCGRNVNSVGEGQVLEFLRTLELT